MARARTLKPSFFKNEDLADLPPEARLLFAGLWCIADRDGRVADKPRTIRAEIFPYHDYDVDAFLNDLQSKGFIKRYEVSGIKAIQILEFAEHQNPHPKESSSGLPSMPSETSRENKLQDSEFPEQAGPITYYPLPITSSVASAPNPSEKFLKSAGPEIIPKRDEFDEFWDAYPLKTRRNEAEIAFDVAVNRGAPPGDLVKAAITYAESDLSDGKGNKFKFAKNPVDWLRDERFKDFLPKEGEAVKIPPWLDNPNIRQRFDQATIIHWLIPLQYVNGGDKVTLTAPNRLIFNRVNQQYRDDLEAALGKQIEMEVLA